MPYQDNAHVLEIVSREPRQYGRIDIVVEEDLAISIELEPLQPSQNVHVYPPNQQ